MDGSFRLEVAESPDPAELALLEDRVEAAAAAAAGGSVRDLAVFVRDDDGVVVAGVCGLVWGGCCELQALWVAPELRGRGLARALMEAAEAEAARQGCALVLFHAYDVLVGGLHERLGYRTVAVVEGCPAGSATRWFSKALERPVSS